MYARTTIAGLLLIFSALSCGDEKSGCQEGEHCGAGRFCVADLCLDGDADPDNDGLTVAQELEYGLSPVNADSDGDGILDGLEWPGRAATPPDTDGDGVIDGLESALVDGDGDCLPDQVDPHNDEADALDVAKGFLCPTLGVCGLHADAMVVVCTDGAAVCELGAVPGYVAVEEGCDGEDNDCDGSVDEGTNLGGVPLGDACKGVGACSGGVVECHLESGQAVCSTGPLGSASQAQPEVCDLVDNDCDGETDEGMTFEGIALGDPCTGLGECGEGTVVCRAEEGVAICSTMSGGPLDESEAETCDGRDNDCDGQSDEGLFSPDLSSCPSKGVCATHAEALQVVCIAGEWLCDASAVPDYTGSEESLCDGLDNDCDGAVDEDFQATDFDGAKKAIQAPCGTGPCVGGVVVCNATHDAAVCSTWDNQSEEVCDGQDNDCDGSVDDGLAWEGIAVGDTCKGTGQCGTGKVECDLEKLVAICSSNPGGSASEAMPESCNGLDDDCDGETDEELGSGDPCQLPGLCEDVLAEATCVLGEWLCDYSFVAGYEAEETTCDSQDNDCDGWVDEELGKGFEGSVPVVFGARPPARGRAAAAVAMAKGGLYFSGGEAHPFPYPGENTCLSDLWFFSLVEGTWSELPGGPVAPRWGHSLSYDSLTDSLIILGGRCGNETTATAWRLGADGADYQLLDLPQSVVNRYGHAVFQDHDLGRLVVVGGHTDEGMAPTLVVNTAGEIEESLTDGPQVAFSAACADPISNMAYLFGGELDDGTVSDVLYVIDLASMAVTPVTGGYSPGSRVHGRLACSHDSVFLFGGVDPAGELLNDAWVYDVADGSWTHGPTGPLARREALVAAWEDELHMLGGLGKMGRQLRDHWVLSDAGWENVTTPAPPDLAGAAYALDPVGRRACLTGGFESGTVGPLPNYNLWCLDLASGSWEQVGPPLAAPAIFATMSFDPNANRFLLVGGALFPEGGEPQPLSPACRYASFDLVGEAWSPFGACGESDTGPGPRSAHAAAVRWKDLALWVYGGLSAAGLSNELWRYHLDSGGWDLVELTPGHTLPGRYGHAVWLREEVGELLIMGGATGSGAALLVDLKTLTVSDPISVPGWFNHGFAPLFHDDTSEVALFLHPDAPAGTQVTLVDSMVQDGTVLNLGESLLPVSFAASYSDPWRRTGVCIGGLDARGLTRSRVTHVPTTCP